MQKHIHNLIVGVSVFPALLVMPAVADDYYTWSHPNIESYASIDGNVNHVVTGGIYNFITGTSMRDIVNGNVNLVLDGVIQEAKTNPHKNDWQETNVFGSLFLPSTTTIYLSTSELGVTTPTDNTKNTQQWINGDVNVTVKNNSLIENSVIGVNFYADNSELTESGLSGKTTVTVDNSTVNYSVRGANFRDVNTPKTTAHVGDIELNVNNSLIKEEIISVGSAASAGDVVINVTGDTVVGYTTKTGMDTKGDGWIIGGTHYKGATIENTQINLNTAGTIRVAGDVNAGSRDRSNSSKPQFDPEEGSVRGDAMLNMFGGGNIEIGGDVRAYHVAGDTTLSLSNIDVTVGGAVKEFQTISMDENSELTADSLIMTSDDVMNVVLADTNKYSKINVETLDAGGATLNMSVRNAGTYKVVNATSVVDNSDFNWNLDNLVYELKQEKGTVTATVRSAESIVEKTGLANDSAQAVSHVAKSSSEKLQDLSLKLQEKLIAAAEGDAGASADVEHATKAVHPETESVAQSVSTSVQNTIVNLASARMATPSAGRNGGDVKFTKGGVWVQGLFNKSKQGDIFNGYTRGVAAGLDGTINKRLTIGAGYSYAHSDITGTARDTKINSNTVFLYGQYKPSELYINAIANYTISDYSENGTVIEGSAITADYKSKSFGGAVNAGYDFASGITPELGLRYMHVSTDDYANSYGVKTHMDNTNFLTGVFGAKYAFNVAAGRHMKVMPQLNAGVKYDLASDKNLATITMPGVDSYTLEGNRLSRLGGEFGIGLGMNYHNLDLSVNYDIDVRDNYTSQTGMLKFRCNF